MRILPFQEPGCSSPLAAGKLLDGLGRAVLLGGRAAFDELAAFDGSFDVQDVFELVNGLRPFYRVQKVPKWAFLLLAALCHPGVIRAAAHADRCRGDLRVIPRLDALHNGVLNLRSEFRWTGHPWPPLSTCLAVDP